MVVTTMATLSLAATGMGRRDPKCRNAGQVGANRREGKNRASDECPGYPGNVRIRHLDVSCCEIAVLSAPLPLLLPPLLCHPEGTFAPDRQTSLPGIIDDGRQ
ncbi:hypothetical protein ACFSZS_09565 [Seohaeicola zhoushanensis]